MCLLYVVMPVSLVPCSQGEENQAHHSNHGNHGAEKSCPSGSPRSWLSWSKVVQHVALANSHPDLAYGDASREAKSCHWR